uniref:Transmembrane and coiled-coil domain-containing protein 4 n=1 Tax=Syphacia muris TaxID=451379 RepID=A0A0N5AQH0_9BILA
MFWNSASSSRSTLVCNVEAADVVLKGRLNDVTKFAFADLLTTVLRLDFMETSNADNRSFCTSVQELMLKALNMPERTNKSLRCHLVNEGATDDIFLFVTIIKKDLYVAENGCISLIRSILMVLLEDGRYDARYRVFLRHVCSLLSVNFDEFEDFEDGMVEWILNADYVESENSIKARVRKKRVKKIKRYALIGAAGGIGGVLIGLTGGLAAPLVAAGASVIIGSGAAAGIATTAGAAILGSAFGFAGAGLAGYKMEKRVGAVEEFVIETLTEGQSLHCVLVVSGWIDSCGTDAFHYQWRRLDMSREQYTLRYESKYLVELGRAMDYFMSIAVSVAVQKTLMETALAGLLTAVAWPVAILSVASVLDNPWNVCISRAAEVGVVGEQLAEVLLSRAHGLRPITLIGFSLGARVLFHCLLAMSERSDAVGIVEDVVLLGAPVSASPKQWRQMCSVVSGRIINGYCETDWLLRFLYRTMSVQFTIAGTSAINERKERKIVNFNLSHIVKGHLDYSRKLPEVLEAVGVKIK